MTAVGLAAWNYLRPSPDALYEEAAKIVASNAREAERLFRRSIARAGGRFPDAQLQLSLLEILRGDWDAARKTCIGLDWQGGRSDLLARFGQEALAAREWDLAMQAFLELRKRPSPEAVVAVQGLATLHQLQRRPAEALASMEELTALAPGDPRWWWQLAQAHERRENPSAAAAVYRRALEHALPRPDVIEMRHRLIERLLDEGDRAGARDELERLVALGDLQVARNQVHRAHLDRLAGDFQAALADLDLVWSEIHEMTDAIKLRAILQLDVGHFDAARQGLEIVVAAHPFDEVAHFKLAEACHRLGMTECDRNHRALHQTILARRREIRRLLAHSDLSPPTRDTCLELARLHRELEENDKASYWLRAARDAE
jgi:tetratricopeptide (TPR) repeat protein